MSFAYTTAFLHLLLLVSACYMSVISTFVQTSANPAGKVTITHVSNTLSKTLLSSCFRPRARYRASAFFDQPLEPQWPSIVVATSVVRDRGLYALMVNTNLQISHINVVLGTHRMGRTVSIVRQRLIDSNRFSIPITISGEGLILIDFWLQPGQQHDSIRGSWEIQSC